jgi:hypothetical protein
MIAGLQRIAVVDGDEVPGPAVGGAGGEPGGLDDAAGGVSRDRLVLELADGEDGADGARWREFVTFVSASEKVVDVGLYQAAYRNAPR